MNKTPPATAAAMSSRAYQGGRTTAATYVMLAAIEVKAIAFTQRGRMRSRCQRRSGAPKIRWWKSQSWKRLELRENAHRARSMNGVVGTTGRSAPTIPSAKKIHPSAKNAQRALAERSALPAGGGWGIGRSTAEF
jgi:hypothetical protein